MPSRDGCNNNGRITRRSVRLADPSATTLQSSNTRRSQVQSSIRKGPKVPSSNKKDAPVQPVGKRVQPVGKREPKPLTDPSSASKTPVHKTGSRDLVAGKSQQPTTNLTKKPITSKIDTGNRRRASVSSSMPPPTLSKNSSKTTVFSTPKSSNLSRTLVVPAKTTAQSRDTPASAAPKHTQYLRKCQAKSTLHNTRHKITAIDEIAPPVDGRSMAARKPLVESQRDNKPYARPLQNRRSLAAMPGSEKMQSAVTRRQSMILKTRI